MVRVANPKIEAMAIQAANRYAGNGSCLHDKDVARVEDKLLDAVREAPASSFRKRLGSRRRVRATSRPPESTAPSRSKDGNA